MSAINNFLLIFDRAKDDLVDVIEFGHDVMVAAATYSKGTHSTYFDGKAKALIETALRAVKR